MSAFIKPTYIDPIKFNCQLYLLRTSWNAAKDSTKKIFLDETKLPKKTWKNILDGEIKNTEYQFDRINEIIKTIYLIENFR